MKDDWKYGNSGSRGLVKRKRFSSWDSVSCRKGINLSGSHNPTKSLGSRHHHWQSKLLRGNKFRMRRGHLRQAPQQMSESCCGIYSKGEMHGIQKGEFTGRWAGTSRLTEIQISLVNVFPIKDRYPTGALMRTPMIRKYIWDIYIKNKQDIRKHW